MNYKKIITFNILLLSVFSLSSQFALPDLSEQDLNALQQDVAAIDEFIKNLPPEEQRKIEEEAFKILAEMPEEDLEKFMQLSEQITGGMQFPEESSKTEEITEPSKPVDIVIDTRGQEKSKKDIAELRAIITTIIEQIDALITKTHSMHQVSDRPDVRQRWDLQKHSVENVRSLLDHLINPVSVDKNLLLSKVSLDENSDYKASLNRIKSTLQRFVPSLKVPDEMGTKKADPNTLRTISQLLSDIDTLSLPELMVKTQTLITKYAPKELVKDIKKDYTQATPSPAARNSGSSHYPIPDYEPGYGRMPMPMDNQYYNSGGIGYNPRTIDDGRYVQHPAGAPLRLPKKGTPSKRTGALNTAQPSKKNGGTMPSKNGGARPLPSFGQKQLKLQEDTQKEFIAAAKEVNEQLQKPVGNTPLIQLDQYLKASGPRDPMADTQIDFTTRACIDATKKMNIINELLKKAPQSEQEKTRTDLTAILEDLGLHQLTTNLDVLKPDQYDAGKQIHSKAVEKFTQACKDFTQALEGQEKEQQATPSPGK